VVVILTYPHTYIVIAIIVPLYIFDADNNQETERKKDIK